ncbi:hypothetical protein HRI_002141600 [Hibiscus trionum]|uniref:Uncharacterized protein n=1 Tax=Hibiscus trionum TaxID=183268 RepID=A0A9W7M1Y7_HIBTR|nr:hypothetical protein HRI_002141600 [Hibiscus trionum]
MEYFSSDMVETPAMDNYNSLFNTNNEEPASLFGIFRLYPVSDPHSLEETAYHGQHERQSDSNCRHWLSEYDSCPGGYWGDYLFQVGGDDDGYKEDYSQSEDQHQSSTSYNHEDGFSHPDCDHNPWCYHQYREEEDGDSYYNYGEEQRTTSGYRIDEMGLCDGIFGYFPCLLQEQNEYNNMQ